MSTMSILERTHAEVAKDLVAKLPPGVFAHAARDAILHLDFTLLNRMLPKVDFSATATGPDEWQLAGTCGDGSVVIWRVGG